LGDAARPATATRYDSSTCPLEQPEQQGIEMKLPNTEQQGNNILNRFIVSGITRTIQIIQIDIIYSSG
jgi:hypothetical protein